MKALITGITGQDGSYLSELLLAKGYEVHGIIRRASQFNTQRIDHIYEKLHLHYGDMTDGACLRHIFNEVQPDEVYNLAAQSHVKVSFECPEYTMDTIATGTLRLLEIIRDVGNKCRMYQASTSEMYGINDGFLNEDTPFAPVSPYATAKLTAHQLCQIYRKAYGVWVACGILFNHESPRRGETFVTRKAAIGAARIKAGLQDKLEFANLRAWRDWGYAGDYVIAMWLMLQQEKPDDFVIASGTSHTVEEMVMMCFRLLGMEGGRYIGESERLKRPIDVPYLRGDYKKAREKLGWKPIIGFEELIKMMVMAEWEKLK